MLGWLLSENHHRVRRPRSASRIAMWAAVEVAIVTAGVLLALQIGVWRQNAEDRAMDRVYLSRLADDLRADTSLYQSIVLHRLPSKLEGLQTAKAWTRGDLQVRDTLAFLNTVQRGAIFGTGTLPVTDFTYRELLATGEMRRVEDVSLKKDLHTYYRELEVFRERIERQRSGYMAFVNGYATFDYSRPLHIAPDDRRRMIEAMDSDRFTTLVNLEYTYAQIVEQETVELRGLAEDLIDRMDALMR
jgi:hypothetical protein